MKTSPQTAVKTIEGNPFNTIIYDYILRLFNLNFFSKKNYKHVNGTVYDYAIPIYGIYIKFISAISLLDSRTLKRNIACHVVTKDFRLKSVKKTKVKSAPHSAELNTKVSLKLPW